jgi:hypothetical protein
MKRGTLSSRDFAIATVIALVMGSVFVWIGGTPLLATFIPGLVVTWAILLWMYSSGIELPDGANYYPFYFGLLAWQFIHFTEEFMTGFRIQFPELFGATPFSTNLFVGINMFSYFVFIVGFLLTFVKGLKFFLVPVLFFIVYGALGNAISHTWWVIWTRGYFPGFFTAQLYWILGPLVLARLTGSWKVTLVATGLFGAVLVSVLSMTMIT